MFHILCSTVSDYLYSTPQLYIYHQITTTKQQITIDRFTQHRYKADQAFELNNTKSPVAAYLDIDTIVQLCVQNGVEAVHPGYGFLRYVICL